MASGAMETRTCDDLTLPESHSKWKEVASKLEAPDYLKLLYPHDRDEHCVMEEVQHKYYVHNLPYSYSVSSVWKVFFPEFDVTKEGDDQLDSRKLGLLVPQEPVVSIPDEKPESPEVPIETLVRGEPPVHAPARTVPADASGGATKPTLDEPNQILAADDTFISLATHDDDGEPKDANGGSLQLETDSNSTSLLFLLFSVTLNLFLGAQVFRHYRN